MKSIGLFLLLSLSLVSVGYAQNAMVSERRDLRPFSAIYAKGGIDVYIKQNDSTTTLVEGTLQEMKYLMTEVVEDVLYIYYSDKRLKDGRNRKGRVYITIPTIAGIKSRGGSDVYGEGIFKLDEIELIATGGSDIRMAVVTKKLVANSSGGADIILSGETDFFNAEASGGSDINAHDLKVKRAELQAGGGADIHISFVNELSAEVHGGADISYRGTPDKVYVVQKGGGDVKRRN
ncbi:MAG: head GIN domain-containing protein [Imperialibacter sp.]